MKSLIPILLVFTAMGCKTQMERLSSVFSAPVNDLRKRVSTFCSQGIVNLWFIDKNAEFYIFGPLDDNLRSEIKEKVQVFIDTGRDFDPTDLISKKMPTYHSSCMTFYESTIQQCAHLLDAPEKYQPCVAPADATYKEILTFFLLESNQGNGKLDLETFELAKVQKALRQKAIDPDGSLLKR